MQCRDESDERISPFFALYLLAESEQTAENVPGVQGRIVVSDEVRSLSSAEMFLRRWKAYQRLRRPADLVVLWCVHRVAFLQLMQRDRVFRARSALANSASSAHHVHFVETY